METAFDVALGVAGVLLVALTLDSAVRTFVLPRGVTVMYTRIVFVSMRRMFVAVMHFTKTYEARDRVMALYAPLTLLVLPFVWIVMTGTGFTLLFRSVGIEPWRRAFEMSGSSMLTLGFVQPPDTLPAMVLAFFEAGIGLGLLALLIAYLPTIYSAFSKREVLVAQLSVRAGTPPSAFALLRRAHLTGEIELLDDVWVPWQTWFAEVEETHTSLGVLSFFRSPQADRSWITAAGVVLDSAALAQSTLAVRWSPQAAVCIRSGFLALRQVADLFGIPYDPDPAQGDPISIAREEFDELYEELAAAGVPMRPDRERCWREFAGWRVNYDAVLIGLAGLVMAPYAVWSSDRSLRYRRPRILFRRRKPKPRDDVPR
ncbi:MAG TPA: hypothetical protein VF441_08115 [Acidimicrobiia bacterium]